MRQIIAIAITTILVGITPALAGQAHRDVHLQSQGTVPGIGVAKKLILDRAMEIGPKAGLPAADVGSWLQLQGFSNSGQEMGIAVVVQSQSLTDEAAEKFLDNLLAPLKEPIAKAYLDLEKEQARQAAEYHDNLVKKHAAATRAVAETSSDIRNLTERVNASDDSIRAVSAKLEDELEQLQIDLVAKNERREAMEEEIAKQSAIMEDKAAHDPIANELQKVVDAMEAQVKRVEGLVAENKASKSELSEAIGKAAEARAKLLQRKHDAAMEAGGDVLATFNRELLTLAIDIRELTVREKFVKEKLDRMHAAADQLKKLHDAEAVAENTAATLHGSGFNQSLFGGGNVPSEESAPLLPVSVTIDPPPATKP